MPVTYWCKVNFRLDEQGETDAPRRDMDFDSPRI
jgi:hypothetical protein